MNRRKLLKDYLRLCLGGVMTISRPPVASDFGGGGIDAPIVIDERTGTPYIMVNGAIISLMQSANPNFTGTITLNGTPTFPASFYLAGNIPTTSASPSYGIAQYQIVQGLDINQAYCCYNAEQTISNASQLNHVIGYQTFIRNGVNTGDYYSFGSFLQQTAGTSTNAYGMYHNDVGGVGAVTNQYGFYCGALAKATNNWGCYVVASTPSFFGGKVGVNADPRTGANLVVGGTAGAGVRMVDIFAPGMADNNTHYTCFGDSFAASKGFYLAYHHNALPASRYMALTAIENAIGASSWYFTANGQVGIGMVPTAQLELATDSAKKPTTNTWTISSDERLKENIVLADPERCYAIVRDLPLKHFRWKDSVYNDAQARDRSKLGWIAQDVQKVFPKAVDVHSHALQPVEDGFEEFDEQVVEQEERPRTYVEIVDGKPIQRTVTETVNVPQFDLVALLDEAGAPVVQTVLAPSDSAFTLPDGRPVLKTVEQPVLHEVPRMRKSRRPKMRVDHIDDCLSLNSDQIYAALYGAVQFLQQKVERLEAQIAAKA